MSRKYGYSLLRRNLLLFTQQTEELKILPLPPRLQLRENVKKHLLPFSDLGKEGTGMGADICSWYLTLLRDTALTPTTHCWTCCLPHSSWPSVDLDVKTCSQNPANTVFAIFHISNCPYLPTKCHF